MFEGPERLSVEKASVCQQYFYGMVRTQVLSGLVDQFQGIQRLVVLDFDQFRRYNQAPFDFMDDEQFEAMHRFEHLDPLTRLRA
jgi:hypothetical protein